MNSECDLLFGYVCAPTLASFFLSCDTPQI
jgi:hypothetical protein